MRTSMTAYYSPQRRAERLIATGRVGLVAITLLAIWVDPSGLALSLRTAFGLLVGYLVCALLILLRVWRSPAPLGRLPLASHAFDLAVFCLVVIFARGATGLVFVYAAFPLASATLRWLWRGTLWTAAAVLGAHVVLGAVAGYVVGDPAVEPARVIDRKSVV